MEKKKIDSLIKKISDFEYGLPWEHGWLTSEEITTIIRLLMKERNTNEEEMPDL